MHCFRDLRFTLIFWESLREALGTKMKLSFAYHPKTNSHTERTIQCLEDLLRARVLEKEGNWNNYFPLINFTYNNNYYSSIIIAPF